MRAEWVCLGNSTGVQAVVDICFIHVVQLSFCLLHREIILINMEIKLMFVMPIVAPFCTVVGMAVGCPLKACLLTSPKSTQKYLQRPETSRPARPPSSNEPPAKNLAQQLLLHFEKKKKSHHLSHYPVKKQNETNCP